MIETDRPLVDLEQAAIVQAQLDSDRLRRRRRRVERLNIGLAIAAAIAGALLGTCFAEGSKTLDKPILLGFTAATSVLSIGLYFFLVAAQDLVADAEALVPADAYFQLRESRRRLDAAENSVLNLYSWLRFQHAVEAEVLRFEQYVFFCLEERAESLNLERLTADIEKRFQSILDSVVEQLENGRQALLNFRSENETYFFDIFEVRKDADDIERLHPVARAHSSGATAHGRAWEIGDGEVGDCVYRQATILRDAKEAPLRRTENWRDTDEVYFARRISAPILAGDNRPHHAYGAICLTSSDPGRFRSQDSLFVENLSQPLAALFQRRELARSRISELRPRLRLPQQQVAEHSEKPAVVPPLIQPPRSPPS